MAASSSNQEFNTLLFLIRNVFRKEFVQVVTCAFSIAIKTNEQLHRIRTLCVLFNQTFDLQKQRT